MSCEKRRELKVDEDIGRTQKKKEKQYKNMKITIIYNKKHT